MDFENKLISGLFVKRYKRFFVDIKINDQIITAHCPNTGSMYGLLKMGSKVWVSKSNNPNRKLNYTLEIIEDRKAKVGVNTHSTNKIVHHALKNNLIKELKNSIEIKPETKFLNLPKSIRCDKHRIGEYDNKIPSDLTAEQILIRSGNIGSVRIAQLIGPEKHKSFLKKVGVLS